MNNNMEPVRKKKIQKPIGIYVISIAVIIVLGVFQLLRYWIEYQNVKELPFIMAFIPLFLCSFTIVSAIWAMVGDNYSRITLLTFVSLNFLWWLYLIVMLISYEDPKNVDYGVAVMTLIRPLAVLIFCWVYLSKKEVVEYYKSVS